MGTTYNPGITIRSAPGIPARTRHHVGRLVAWLRETQRVEDGLIVALRPEPAVEGGGGIGFASISLPRVTVDRAPGRFIWMPVGCGFVEVAVEEWGETEAEALNGLLHNILHEFAHYEQYRDGREVQERGVNVRATSLLRCYRKANPHRPIP